MTTVVSDAPIAAQLTAGRAPLYEPGLDDLLQHNQRSGTLRFTTWSREALASADFVFLSIDTPVGPGDQSDLAPIFDAVQQIGRYAASSFTVCVTAQVPVGTSASIGRMLATQRPDLDIRVAYVPEFLRLGTAIGSFREADRYVIGADDPDVADRVATLYEPLQRPIFRTTVATAEMAKHASNAFLATSISFINQVADLCEQVGADVTGVTQILKLDRRIGPHAFLNAGLGYAGGTLGREVQALRQLGERHNVKTDLLDGVDLVNSNRLTHLLARLRRALYDLSGIRIALWGLTYKTGTSTLRRSAALRLIELLHSAGVDVAAFDPFVRRDEVPEIPPFQLSATPEQAVKAASALILIVPWSGVDNLDFREIARSMSRPALFDTANALSPAQMVEAGFEYYGVGR